MKPSGPPPDAGRRPWMVRARGVSLALVLVLTVLAAWGATKVRLDTSIDVWFLEDDPDLLAYHRFLEVFDSDQIIVVAWEDEELWTDEGLRFVHELSTAAGELRHVQKVRSITTEQEVISSPGALETRPLYDPEAPPDPDALRRKLSEDPLLAGRLTSTDGGTAALVLLVDHLTDEQGAKMELARSVQAMAGPLGEARGLRMRYAGPTILDDAFFTYTQSDLLRIFPLMGVILVISILALYRTFHALVLPLTVVAGSCLWPTGMMGWLGWDMTVMHSAVYPLILGVGIASSIHVCTRYLLLRGEGRSAESATDDALSDLLEPCLFTALTTVAGLMSLQTASLGPVRAFGALGSAGVVSSLVLTFALGPWLLPRLPAPKWSGQPGEHADRLDRALVKIGGFAHDHPRRVLLVSVLLLSGALLGLTQLTVGANVVDYFRSGTTVKDDLVFVDKHLSGTTSLEVLVVTPEDDGLKDPEVLAAMRELQEWMGGLEGVGGTVSLVDYLSELRRVMHGGDEVERRLPATRAEAAQLLLLLNEPELLERLVDFPYRRGRITATVKMSQVEELAAMVPEVERRLRETLPEGVTATATGTSKLINNMQQYLLSSQIRSLGLAFVTVLLCMGLALRSARLGLFSMIPNVMPIGIALGSMGWVGIPLDPGTAMTGAVALGLVVDDTVHFLHTFGRYERAGMPLREAISTTLRRTGRAILMTSVILTAGFLVMCTASFLPNIRFGLLCAFAATLALLANVMTLPAAIALVKPWVKH